MARNAANSGTTACDPRFLRLLLLLLPEEVEGEDDDDDDDDGAGEDEDGGDDEGGTSVISSHSSRASSTRHVAMSATDFTTRFLLEVPAPPPDRRYGPFA